MNREFAMLIRLSEKLMSKLRSLACEETTPSHSGALAEIKAKKLSPSKWETRFGGVAKQVRDLLSSQHHRPAVTVEPDWYY